MTPAGGHARKRTAKAATTAPEIARPRLRHVNAARPRKAAHWAPRHRRPAQALARRPGRRNGPDTTLWARAIHPLRDAGPLRSIWAIPASRRRHLGRSLARRLAPLGGLVNIPAWPIRRRPSGSRHLHKKAATLALRRRLRGPIPIRPPARPSGRASIPALPARQHRSRVRAPKTPSAAEANPAKSLRR